MKLRILHLVQFLGVGGLEKVLFLLINEQLTAGHEVELVVYDYEQEWVEYFRNHGINVTTNFKKSDGYDYKLLKYLNQKVKTFDIVHTHDLNPLMYASPLKLLHTITGRYYPRLIHTAHGMNHLHKRPITKLYEKLCSFQTNITVGVSTAVCDYYYRLGLTKIKVANINNGTHVPEVTKIDFQEMRNHLRQSLCLASNSIIWISVARVVPLKDQKIICELAKRLPNQTFLIVGPVGDELYGKELSEYKPNNVRMLGARSDINELLAGSDFFISASKHEGIPISVLEAGAIGIPCLLSDISGHKVIQAGNDESIALFFKTGDIQDLAEKVCFLQNNQDLAKAFGTALHQHVKTNFSSISMYKRYLKAYLG